MSASETTAGRRAQDPYRDCRVELACAFRWTAREGMHEAVANHFSLAVEDAGTRFLINPAGRHFSRLRASELLLVDATDQRTLEWDDAPDPTAWGLHGALHRRHPEARCVLHVHPEYATVLASLADSTLPPLDQNCARFFNRVAVDKEYGGLALGEEAERCVRRLGDKRVMLMGSHGVLVVEASVARAFDTLYYFERACRTLVTAYMTGRPLRILADDVAERTARQWEEMSAADRHFSELMAILDEEEPDYRA